MGELDKPKTPAAVLEAGKQTEVNRNAAFETKFNRLKVKIAPDIPDEKEAEILDKIRQILDDYDGLSEADRNAIENILINQGRLKKEQSDRALVEISTEFSNDTKFGSLMGKLDENIGNLLESAKKAAVPNAIIVMILNAIIEQFGFADQYLRKYEIPFRQKELEEAIGKVFKGETVQLSDEDKNAIIDCFLTEKRSPDNKDETTGSLKQELKTRYSSIEAYLKFKKGDRKGITWDKVAILEGAGKTEVAKASTQAMPIEQQIEKAANEKTMNELIRSANGSSNEAFMNELRQNNREMNDAQLQASLELSKGPIGLISKKVLATKIGLSDEKELDFVGPNRDQLKITKTKYDRTTVEYVMKREPDGKWLVEKGGQKLADVENQLETDIKKLGKAINDDFEKQNQQSAAPTPQPATPTAPAPPAGPAAPTAPAEQPSSPASH